MKISRPTCPQCGSEDVVILAEGAEDYDEVAMDCGDCGRQTPVTKIPVTDVFR